MRKKHKEMNLVKVACFNCCLDCMIIEAQHVQASMEGSLCLFATVPTSKSGSLSLLAIVDTSMLLMLAKNRCATSVIGHSTPLSIVSVLVGDACRSPIRRCRS